MKKMKNINLLLSAIALVTGSLFTGCFKDKAETALTYKGATVLEVKNQTFGQLAAALNAKGVYSTTPQTDSTRTVLLNSKVTDSVLVQLVGPQQSTPIVVNYSVRAASTAIEGVNYNFRIPNARTVTFAPNTSLAYILIDMIPNSITTVGTTRTVAIDILGTSDIKVNPNYNKFILSIRR